MTAIPAGGALFKKPWAVYGWTLAEQGNMKDAAARSRALKSAGLSDERLVTAQQVHGERVETIRDLSRRLWPETDGFLTELPQVILGIYAADCAPVFLFEEKRRVLGLLHAGRRGFEKKIVTRAVERIKREGQTDVARLRVVLGPHIRQCCYEVGPDVAGLFPNSVRSERGGKVYLDLEGALREELRELGCAEDALEASPDCTRCDPRYFSFRRDKTENRMLSFAVKTSG